MADTVGGQIISELGEIGKKVGSEAVKIPKDIAGVALESIGASGSNKQGSAKIFSSAATGEAAKNPETAWEKISIEKDTNIRRQMARKALEELTKGMAARPKEPSVWERLQMEQEQKKKETIMQNVQAAQTLPMPASKRPKGDLYGTKAKQTATENRNVRQD
jgi:hypothetical protein